MIFHPTIVTTAFVNNISVAKRNKYSKLVMYKIDNNYRFAHL